MRRTALYAGSFDPLTYGHLWMIMEGADLFDHLYIGIGVNTAKKARFPLQARLDILREITDGRGNITVIEPFSEYTAKVAERLEARFLLRGVRNSSDLVEEGMIQEINKEINPIVQTVFLMPPPRLAHISSSTVVGLMGFPGWEQQVRNYLPTQCYAYLEKTHWLRNSL